MVAFRSSARLSAGVAFAICSAGNMFSYLARLMPLGALAVTFIVPALAFAVAVLLARRGPED
jgi:hypothetical protein